MKRNKRCPVADGPSCGDEVGSEFLLFGRSKVMRRLRDDLDRVADNHWSILLEGSTGTGKTVAASYIHLRSPRRERPFVACSASLLSDGLALSQLLGHSKGAFTGADHDFTGVFEAAHTGTLFIDEVATGSPAVQAALLQLVRDRDEEVVVKRLGDQRPRPVDVRVIAATNVPLEAEVQAGRFRRDLLERLRVLPVRIPDLVQRPDDIPLLFRRYLTRYCDGTGREVMEPSQSQWSILESYNWPGNVRELINVVRYYFVFGRFPEHLVPDDWRVHVPRALEDADGNKAKAARELGVSRPTLNRHLRSLEESKT